MFSLVYVSAAVTWFSDRELRALLAQCRLSNAQTGITGMLLYKDGNFMQALEGEERTVRALEARIAADRRHQGMVTLLSGHTAQRQFSDSVSQPPRVGPRMGPRITAALHRLITRGIICCG